MSLSRVELVHECPPPDGSGITPCCGWTPFELPRTDRLTSDPKLVTCRSILGVHDRRPLVPRGEVDDAWRMFRAACERLTAVQALIDHAKKVSPSDRMTVLVGDLEHALGQRDERARTRTGANG